MKSYLYRILFSSTEEEVKPLLIAYSHEYIYDASLQAYHLPKHRSSIFITGIGPYAAHRSAMRAFQWKKNQEEQIWCNIGICGALQPSKIGEKITPKKISLLSWHPKLQFTEGSSLFLPDGEKTAQLFTSPIPIHQSIPTEVDSRCYIDMEAYPIVEIALKENISCSVHKLVSDICGPTSEDEIQKNLRILQNQLSELGYRWIFEHLG